MIKGSGYMENMEKVEVDVIRALKGDSFEAKLDSIWKELQSHVDHVLDIEMKSSAGTTNRVRKEGRSQLVAEHPAYTAHGYKAILVMTRVRKLNLGWRFSASKVEFSWPSVDRFWQNLGLMTLGQVKSVPNFC